MKLRLFPASLAVAFSSFGMAATTLLSEGGNANGATVYTEKNANYTNTPEGVRLQLGQQFAAYGLNVQGANWSSYTYLKATITNNTSAPTPVAIVFDSGTSGWAWTTTVVGGLSTVDINIPLQDIGRSVSASRLDGAPQTRLFGSFDKSNVRRIRVWNPLRAKSQDLTLAGMTLSSDPVRYSAIVDQFGQQTINFLGKASTNADLQAQAQFEAATLTNQFPFSSDNFGAVAGTAMGNATGRWGTAKQNGKWYIIAPSGNRFFSSGVCEVGANAPVYVTGRDGLFTAGALPAQGSALAAFYEQVPNSSGTIGQGYNYYLANLQRKFGVNWRSTSMDNVVSRMRTWGFNTVGPSSRYEFFEAGTPMVNAPCVRITGSFRTVPSPGASFPMPDPYDTAWATAVTQTLGPVVAKYANVQNNMGLFVDNELPWAGYWEDATSRYNLAFDVLSAPSSQPAKQAFIRVLSLKYRTISKLNTAWGTNYVSWTAMQNNTNFRPQVLRPALVTDLQNLVTQFANQYFSTIRTKLTALNYRGLYLGCRFDFFTPEVVNSAKRYCSVVSFNCYDYMPSNYRSLLKTLDAPVLIGEYAFAASDRGRVGGSVPCAMTESDRVQAYNNFVNDASTWPNLVGMHYYRWADEPVAGRHYDDANETYGLVSITDAPYGEFVEAMKNANTFLQNRLLQP